MKNTRLLLLLVLSLAAFVTRAQEAGDFTFSHLDQGNGMHSLRIYSIQQAPDGAVWWSTKNGVERYNGVSIRHYLLDDSNIYSDRAGKIIKLCPYAEREGLHKENLGQVAFENNGRIFRYDVIQDRFQLIADVAKLLKSVVNLNDILMTAQGTWVGTNDGVYFLHDQTLTPVKTGVHANYFIQTEHSLLVCTRQGVLEYANRQSLPKAGEQMRQLVEYDVESGYFDQQYNKVWLGGYSGGVCILSLSPQGKMKGCKPIESDIDILHNPIRAICPYNDKTMLIGIDGLGVYQANRQQDTAGNYVGRPLFDANEGPQGMLHGNGIYAMLCDTWGNIFVGSYSGGIDIARPVGTTIAIFQHMPNNQQSILNDRVNCVAQIGSHTLVMGTDNGVSMYNMQSKTWTHTCRGSVVLGLTQTPQGTLLAATYGKGVLEISADGRSTPLYSKANGILDDDHVYKLFFDRDGNLWMGCLDGSLVKKTAAGCHYYPIHYVKDILQLPEGQIAVATTYGIHVINPATGKTSELKYAPQDEKDVNRYVHTIYLNNGRELWIGTDGGGIYVYHLNTKTCQHLTTNNGLTSNFVNSIIKDVHGRIIIATERGLAFAEPSNHSRIIGVNYCYGVDREYTSRSVVNLSNGYMLFGSTTGALLVDPNHVQEINYTAKLNLVGVAFEDNDDDGLREKTFRMLADRELYLSYAHRTFELFFESINLRNQSDIVYQYKVGKGEWSIPTEQQHIRFTSMEPGVHQLALRCVSRTCGATLDEVQLTLHIHQPWWNSWWMWLVYICLVALAFWGAWRIYQLHTKYMRLVLNNPGITAKPDADRNEDKQAPAEETHDEEGSAFIEKVTQLVVDNLSDTDFTIDRLCREMAMSRTLFYVKLKSYTGKSPQDFIRIIRLERAAALLRKGRQVTDAAALAGFDNPKYFSTVFKKYFGVSPSKY